jgi:UDP-N-acetylglucosamine 2-epimerase (non-hydrolysing)
MIALVAGTRSDFVKIAPVHRALAGRGHALRLIRAGQPGDPSADAAFFGDLGIPAPSCVLPVSGASAGAETASALVAFEGELRGSRPDLLVVVGDVASALGAALTAARIGVPVARVEAGLRARDWTLPEEIHRVLTDQLADLLFYPSPDEADNLLSEGLPAERLVFAGNVRIDALYAALGRRTEIVAQLGLRSRAYGVVTVDHAANVGTREALGATVHALSAIAARLPLVFPVHPRTVACAGAFGLSSRFLEMPGLVPICSLAHDDFVTLMSDARLVATDSGGVQEETTVLGVPCLTLRSCTDRTATVTSGTNQLVGLDPARIACEVGAVLQGRGKRGRIPEGWDGRAGERVAAAVERFLAGDPPARARSLRAAA